MFPLGLTAEFDAVLSALRSAVDEAMGLAFQSADAVELATLLAGVSVEVTRLGAVDRAVIAELDQRVAYAELGASSTADLVAQRLLVSRGEAKARVVAARTFAARRALTGEPLEPVLPLVADELDAGAVSLAHATVIARLLDELPGDVEAQFGVQAQRFLLEQARHVDPPTLSKIAVRLRDTLDQDGVEDRDATKRRRRDFRLVEAADGGSFPTGYLTAALTTALRTVLDPLSAPAVSEVGERDHRSFGQRQHDALLEVVMRSLRSGDLPDSGGTPTTIAVTMTLEQLQSAGGYVTDDFGQQLTVAELLKLAGEAEVIPVVFDHLGGVLSYGRERRFASPAMRRALAARDGGCSFPSCTRPASWTEAHHVRAWADGGSTDLENLVLLCKYDHDTHQERGWTVAMINGVPWWTPPKWLDPDQHPRQNTSHDLITTEPTDAEPTDAEPTDGPVATAPDGRQGCDVGWPGA
jgi:hypothetical protein